MTSQEVFDICERVVSSLLEVWEKLKAEERKKVTDDKLCYAILERKRAPEELQSSTSAAWISYKDAEERPVRIDWEFDADRLVAALEGLPPGEYRWRLYPVGSKAAQFPSCRPNPLSPKGCEIVIGSSALAARVGDGSGTTAATYLSAKTGFVSIDTVRSIVKDTFDAADKERQDLRGWYKEMHATMMGMAKEFAAYSKSVLEEAKVVAMEGRLAQTAAFEQHKQALLLTRRAESDLLLADELMERAEAALEENKAGGLAGVLMQFIDHEDGRQMVGLFVNNLLEKASSLLRKPEDKQKAIDTVKEAAEKVRAAGNEDAYTEIIKRIPADPSTTAEAAEAAEGKAA